MVILLSAALLWASTTLPAAFDRVLLKDGREIEGKIVPSSEPGITRLRLPGAEIAIRGELIDRTWVEDLQGYVPRNEQEQDYLARGWVLFEGRWMSAERREGELHKRAEADRAAIEAARERQDWSHAVTRETRHFVFTSNLDDAALLDCADRLEAYHKAFTEAWSVTLAPADKRGKPHVFLYRTAADFHRLTGKPATVGGFFNPGAGELHIPHDPDDPEEALDVLYHEGNHLLTHLMHPEFRYPIWMDEGLAEYYGTARTDAQGRLVAGRSQDGRIVQLRREQQQGRFRRLRDVLLTAAPDFTFNDYASAWSFVHFLMQSPRHGHAFRSFFASLPENRDIHLALRTPRGADAPVSEAPLAEVITALERRLGTSLDELEHEWLADADQPRAELGPQAWYDAARLELFGASPTGDGSNVRRAVEDFDKAVELGISNARCFRDYAELLRKGGVMEFAGAGQVLPPDPVKAWRMIQRALELDPLQPYNYTEAAGILILDSPVQDLDRAAAMAETALAVAGPRDPLVRWLHDELMDLIGPARESAAGASQR